MPFHNNTNHSIKNNNNSTRFNATLAATTILSSIEPTGRGKKFSPQSNYDVTALKHTKNRENLHNNTSLSHPKFLSSSHSKMYSEHKNAFKSKKSSEVNNAGTTFQDGKKYDISKQANSAGCPKWQYEHPSYKSHIQPHPNSVIIVSYGPGINVTEKQTFESVFKNASEIFYSEIVPSVFPPFKIKHYIKYEKILPDKCKTMGDTRAYYGCISSKQKVGIMKSEIKICSIYTANNAVIAHEIGHALAVQVTGCKILKINSNPKIEKVKNSMLEGIADAVATRIDPEYGKMRYAEARHLFGKTSQGDYSFESVVDLLNASNYNKYSIGGLTVDTSLAENPLSIAAYLLRLRMRGDLKFEYELLEAGHDPKKFEKQLKDGPFDHKADARPSIVSLNCKPPSDSSLTLIRTSYKDNYEEFWCKEDIISKSYNILPSEIYGWIKQQDGCTPVGYKIEEIPLDVNVMISNKDNVIYCYDNRIMLREELNKAETNKITLCPKGSLIDIKTLYTGKNHQSGVQEIKNRCGSGPKFPIGKHKRHTEKKFQEDYTDFVGQSYQSIEEILLGDMDPPGDEY